MLNGGKRQIGLGIEPRRSGASSGASPSVRRLGIAVEAPSSSRPVASDVTSPAPSGRLQGLNFGPHGADHPRALEPRSVANFQVVEHRIGVVQSRDCVQCVEKHVSMGGSVVTNRPLGGKETGQNKIKHRDTGLFKIGRFEGSTEYKNMLPCKPSSDSKSRWRQLLQITPR